jgi:endonuclease III
MKRIVRAAGGRFSRELGIDLDAGRSADIFRWFFASVLFGARISETIVRRTVGAFEHAGVFAPGDIERTGWDGLVALLDRGGYVRYDFKTATKLLDLSRALGERYRGDLNRLHAAAADPRDLEVRLKDLAKGIGDVTVNIFLREMRGVWSKARPLPSDLVLRAAGNLGLVPRGLKNRDKALTGLLQFWRGEGGSFRDFADFEAALLRIGKDFCRKGACSACPVRHMCRSPERRQGKNGTRSHHAVRRNRPGGS